MEIKVLQINTNHSRPAQDAAHRFALSIGAGVICFAEPHNVPQNISHFGEPDGLASIFWHTRLVRELPVSLEIRRNYVLCRIKDLILVSAYISPNIQLTEAENILDDISNAIYKHKKARDKVIISGDLNASSVSWSSNRTSPRGSLVEEWAASLGIVCVNTGVQPTCIRWQGVSCVDTTWITETALTSIRDWYVAEEETLSDHVYIVIEVSSNAPPGRRKNVERVSDHVNSVNNKLRYKEKWITTIDHNIINKDFIKYKWESVNPDMFMPR